MSAGVSRSLWPAITIFLLLDLCALPLVARAEAVVGKITQVAGKAAVKRGSADLKAVAPMPIELHDELRTSAPGEVTLEMATTASLP
jgi:hypothetical protein